MMHLQFLVQGSKPEPYRVTFERTSGNQLHAFCTCPAGQKGQSCKHRFRILEGDGEGVISENAGDVPRVVEWLQETALQEALARMLTAEEKVKAAQQQVSTAKRAIADMMHGRR
ncbi:hypothetical protein SIID45300_01852 [Candidatus Magnetaquicoccaceae bacterium FCR-1]|uniref:SWIM-type domain-containing protein n=1 Tax=Candidatus Magnetaquiglobus chichijimensis TaxID=3141448 RepID=A0ABQ0C9G9_9PROT